MGIAVPIRRRPFPVARPDALSGAPTDAEVFAKAERLAHFVRRSFGSTRADVLAELTAWRDRHHVHLSNRALDVIAAHVCSCA